MIRVSVILPTLNPHPGRLRRTIAGLSAQTLSQDDWELIVVDNASKPPLVLPAEAPPGVRVLREVAPGLTPARLLGIGEAQGDVFVFVDDDNVLIPGFLTTVLDLFAANPRLAAAGGPVRPEFESPAPTWLHEFNGLLALCDHGNIPLIAHGGRGQPWPVFSPVGAGLCIRSNFARSYAAALARQPERASLDRRASDLTSGGDNDIVFTALHAGGDVGYFPNLELTHLIPDGRLAPGYLSRLNQGIQRSWVRVLALHSQCPWPAIRPATLAPRLARAWLRTRAWHGPAERIRFYGLMGRFQGQADLGRARRSFHTAGPDLMSSPRQLYRRFYWAKRDRDTRHLLVGCGQLAIIGQTLGDNLLLGTLARERARRALPGLCISTPHPDLFTGLDGVVRVVPLDWSLLDSCRRLGISAINPFYTEPASEPDHEVSPVRHILAELCRRAGLAAPFELRPYFAPQSAELTAAAPWSGALVFQSSGLAGSHGMRNKEWGADRIAVVVRHFAGRLRMLQIGSPSDPVLDGCEDLRGRTSPRESAAILARAAGFVGLVGFLMHLARAVDCPAVIVYGGREKPWQSGYTCNLNLATNPACSPCWRWQTCDHGWSCLAEITPARVIAATEELLARPRHPLPVETFTL